MGPLGLGRCAADLGYVAPCGGPLASVGWGAGPHLPAPPHCHGPALPSCQYPPFCQPAVLSSAESQAQGLTHGRSCPSVALRLSCSTKKHIPGGSPRGSPGDPGAWGGLRLQPAEDFPPGVQYFFQGSPHSPGQRSQSSPPPPPLLAASQGPGPAPPPSAQLIRSLVQGGP